MLNLGLLILRLGVGLIVAAHGAQKLFGWWQGPRIGGFAAALEKMGLRPPRFWAVAGGLSEFVGGLLVATGFLSPLGSFGVMSAMAVAIVTVHLSRGFWNSKGGLEFALSLLIGALALSVIGPGAYSLDAALNLHLPEPATWIAGALAVAVGVTVALNSGRLLASRKRPEIS